MAVRLLGALLVACLALWLPADTARAQQDTEARYRALIDQALVEFRLRNWPEARALFRRAHALSPSARTLRGLGMVSYEMRDYPQSVRDLRASLEDSRQPLTEQQREEVLQLLKRAQTFVGTFQVNLTPPDATWTLDGAPPVVEQNGTVLIALGKHHLEAHKPGYLPASHELRVEGGENQTLQLTLEPKPSEEPVVASPSPSTPAPATPEPVPHEETRTEGGLRWTWGALGATAALGGATAAVWFTGQGKLDDRVASCRDSSTMCNDKTSDLKLHETLTTVGLALTGAALAGTVIAASFEWPRERPVEVSLGPTQLRIRGHF